MKTKRNVFSCWISVMLALFLLLTMIPAGTLFASAASAGGNAYGYAGDNLISSMAQYTQASPYTVTGKNKDQYTDTGYYTGLLTAGKTYTITAKCDLPWATSHNTSGTNPGTAAVWLYIRDAGGSIISYRFFDMTGDDAVFTAPSGTANTAQVRLQIYGDGTNTYTGHFWDIGLYSDDRAGALTVKAGTGIESVYATGMKNYLSGAAAYSEENPYVISGTAKDDYRILSVYTDVNMIPGERYTISAKSNLPWSDRHATDGSKANTAAVWLYFRDTAGNVVDYHFFNMTGDSAAFTVPANGGGTAQLRLQAYGDGSATHTAKFWNILLVKDGDGNLAQSDTNVLTNAYTASNPYTLSGNTVDRYEYINSYSKYNLTPGDRYVIGAKSSGPWASSHKTDGSQPGKTGLWLVFTNTSGATVTHIFFNLTNGGETSFTVPAGANGKCQIRVQLYSNGSTNYTIRFWDIYMYRPADAPTNIVNTVSYNYPMTVGATVKTGYHWGSWSGALSGSEQNFSFRMPANANAVLTANAEPNSYTVNFSGNGNDGGSTAPLTAYYNADAVLTANGFTKTGYHFTGWRAENGTDYADGATIRNLTTEHGKSFTFTAQWEINTYTVRFLNGYTGAEVGDAQTVTHGSPATAPTVPAVIKAENPSAHYVFTGWDKEFSSITGDTDVTAVYEQTGHNWGGYTDNGDGTHTHVCADCGYVETVAHTYRDAVTAPTCTTGGFTTHTCTACGNSYTDGIVPADGHSYGAWEPNGDGTHTKTCAVCGETTEGHTKTANCDYNETAHAATCLTGAYITYTCKDCGYSYDGEAGSPNGHSFTEYVEEVTPATCEANATAAYKCENCDETTVKEVPDTMLSHSYTGEVRSNEDGAHVKKCVNGCGAYGPAEECDYKDEVTAPTCTEGGYTTHTCKVCGYSFTDTETAATGHHFTEYVEEVTPATCEANATATYKCRDCDGTATQEVPNTKLSHSYTGDAQSNEDGAHVRKCVNGCGAYGPAEECDYKDEVTAPTCTEGGFTTHTCKVCGYSFTDTETAATGHHFTEFLETVSAGTCVDNRVDRFKCADCDETEERGIENTKDPENHVGEERTENRNATNATCVTEGSYDRYTVCVSCGQDKGFVHVEGMLDPTNHQGETRTEIEDVVPGTCAAEKTWNEVVYCADCGEPISSTPKTGEKDPENHVGETYTKEVNVVPGTCAAPKTWDEVTCCAGCDAELSRTTETGEKDPDNHVGGTETKIEDLRLATCVAKESWNEAVYCKGCGDLISSTPAVGGLNPNNHAGPIEVRDRVEATAEEDGYTGDTYCAACNTLLSSGSSIRRTKGLCPYCGGYHEGVWGSVVTAVHGVLWLLRAFLNNGLFGK